MTPAEQRIQKAKQILQSRPAPVIDQGRVERAKQILAERQNPAPVAPDKKSVGGFFKNVLKSGGRLVKDVASAAVNTLNLNPDKNTFNQIAAPVAGAVEKLIPGRQADEDSLEAVGSFYKDRYGGGKQFMDTLYKDPVGVASDAATIFGLAASAGRAAKLSKVSQAAGAAEKALNPLDAGSGAVRTTGAADAIAGRLAVSAEKQMTQVLGPTTKVSKAKAAKVVPEMLNRGTKAFTKEGLKGKAESGIAKAGVELEDAYAALPQGVRTNFGPVFDDLQQRKQAFLVEGTGGLGDEVGRVNVNNYETGRSSVPVRTGSNPVIADEAAYQAIESMQRRLLEVANENVSVGSMRSLRQIWDKATARTNKSFALSDTDSAVAAARKAGANAIRAELAKEFPEIGKVNAEYTFWKTVDELMTENINRTKPQTGAMQNVAGIVGAATGSTGLEMLLRGLAFKNFVKLTQSTGWRTISATTKNRLADLLASGNAIESEALIKRLLNQAAFTKRGLIRPQETQPVTE